VEYPGLLLSWMEDPEEASLCNLAEIVVAGTVMEAFNHFGRRKS